MGQLQSHPHRFKLTRCNQCGEITHIARNVIKVQSDVIPAIMMAVIGFVSGALVISFSKLW